MPVMVFAKKSAATKVDSAVIYKSVAEALKKDPKVKNEILKWNWYKGSSSDDPSQYPYATGVLKGNPKGYTQNIAALTNTADDNSYRLYLFAANEDFSDAVVLSYTDDVSIDNPAKTGVWIDCEGNAIGVYSQLPYSAIESDTMFKWNGKSLEAQDTEGTDPTQKAYDAEEKLIAKGDIDGFIKFDKNADLEYVQKYDSYYTLPQKVIKLAHAKALAAGKAGDIKRAITLLKFGIDYYDDGAAVDDISPGISPSDVADTKKISQNEFCTILNDYAYFLSSDKQYKEAEQYLKRVNTLCPDRAVAYFNLGDVYWETDNKTLAVDNYKKYVTLVKNKNVIPQQVLERIKAAQ